MPKVVVAVKGHHNYSSASKFGDVVFISEKPVNIFSSSNLRAEMEEWIDKNYQQDDFLCLSGHLLPTAIVYHAIMQKYNSVKMLVWIGNINQYKMVTVHGG